MYDGVGWPVRSTQTTIIVLTLQASLKNQSFTQGYTVCCRKRLTLSYDCYALTGLMNAMSRNYAYYSTKSIKRVISVPQKLNWVWPQGA